MLAEELRSVPKALVRNGIFSRVWGKISSPGGWGHPRKMTSNKQILASAPGARRAFPHRVADASRLHDLLVSALTRFGGKTMNSGNRMLIAYVSVLRLY